LQIVSCFLALNKGRFSPTAPTKKNSGVLAGVQTSTESRLQKLLGYFVTLSTKRLQKTIVFLRGRVPHNKLPNKKNNPPLIGGFFVGNFLWIS
jgi:hypothetical protein